MQARGMWLAVLSWASLLLPSAGGGLDGGRGETERYERDVARIKALARSKDLAGLERLADEIEQTWRTATTAHYARLMLKVAETFMSEDFRDRRQYDLARGYAALALEKIDPARYGAFPIDVEVKLLLHLQVDAEYDRGQVRGQEWAALRKRKALRWFRAWKRLTDGIDETWDPNDLPLSNIAPPAATGLPSGVAPRHIKDPKLRARYEAEIQRHARKARRNRTQALLRRLDRRFSPVAEVYIIQAYSKPPYRLSELEALLKAYVADDDRRARIVEGAARTMGEKRRR